jgi:hypothetical protein
MVSYSQPKSRVANGVILKEFPMLKIALLVLTLHLGIQSLASYDRGIQFSKEDCLKRIVSRNAMRLCESHESQFSSALFFKKLIYRFNYATCDQITGDLSRNLVSSVPCVNYFVESELAKEVVSRGMFGLASSAPYKYRDLMFHISVFERQKQME